ncbi:hypothetical protein B9Z55_020735 [Caenorhabditis nigoni]|uniref:Uncharacterized protein n=1 Tax=Caenorhabditis nigoni TaxID=1611254 RepID=A0A2G5TNW3_9PELO|nr:hypothetical protein B9Z55_020735 [Caenorhabditis nigoni]
MENNSIRNEIRFNFFLIYRWYFISGFFITGLSLAIDCYNLDKTENIKLSDSENFLLWHFIGFIMYQVVHYIIAIATSGCIDRDFYPLLIAAEAIQAYIVLLYHRNTIITSCQNSAEQLFNLFYWSFKFQYFSVYMFLFCSFVCVIVPIISSFFSFIDLNDEADLTYEKNHLIFWNFTYQDCRQFVSKIHEVNILPQVFVVFLDLAFFVNSQQLLNYKFKGDTPKTVFAFCTFFIMVAYQFLWSARIGSSVTSHKHHVCWVRWEIAQLLLSVIWLFNPFYTSCPEKYFLPEIFMKYTYNYQYVTFILFLLTNLFNCYMYYEMSQIVKYKKRLRNVILYQQSVKFGGISYKTWVYSIFVLLLIPLFSIPIAWYLDESEYHRFLTFSDLWTDDKFKMNFRIVFLLWCFIWIQLLHISLFGCFAFSNFDMAGLFSMEIGNLLLTLVISVIWFFPNLVGSVTFVDYFLEKYPRTSDALTVSLVIFLVLILTLLLLSIEIGNPDPKKIDDYEVLDGQNTSSTKKGTYVHPFYLNGKNIPEMENLRKRK